MNPLRVIVAVGSLMITVVCVAASVLIMVAAEWYKAVPTLLIGAVFGFFTVRDVKALISKR